MVTQSPERINTLRRALYEGCGFDISDADADIALQIADYADKRKITNISISDLMEMILRVKPWISLTVANMTPAHRTVLLSAVGVALEVSV